MGRKLELIPPKHEAITPEERRQLVALRDAIAERERAAQEAVLSAQEAKTEFDFCLLALRRKYKLRMGDSIDDKTGTITRA